MNLIKALFMLAAALTCVNAALVPDGVSVTSVVHGRTGLEPVPVILRAIRVDGSGLSIERTISVPGSVTVDIPPGVWDLSIQSSVLWSAPYLLSGSRTVSLDLWPVGTLRGTLKEQRGSRIEELRVSFAPTMENPGGDVPAGESTCSIESERWSCLLPVGIHDLRLLSRGFATEFHWNQEVREGGELDLGQVTLRRGASLHGFVSTGLGVESDIKGVVIIARPRSLSDEAPRSYTARANRRGFFQIAGLPPGDYLVFAEAKPLRSEKRPATIIEDWNAELRSPLLLEPPRKIVLTISPPLSSEELPWHVRLYSYPTDAGGLEEVLTSSADRGGGWSSEVVPGQYFLQIGHSDRSVWSSTEFAVTATDVFLDLSIPAVQVSGSVKLGDLPLPHARLIFGGAQGSKQQTLVTDPFGHFSGEIPAITKNEKKWDITIEAEAPQVQRTAEYEPVESGDGHLRFDIELPRTMMSGRVVNEDGTGEEGSILTLQSADEHFFEQAIAGRDGHFELFGFEPGDYCIQAEGFQRSSEIMNIHASETDIRGIEIVLKKDVRIRGRVLSRYAGVVGARLTASPRDTRTAFVPEATTDGNGNFELRLPPLTRTFDLAVLAHGFALASGRVFIRDDKILTITVAQNGGGLILEFPLVGDAVIRHDGAEFPARWFAALSGGLIESRDGWNLATLPDVEDGEYSLCADSRCRTGFVTPHGTLLLSLRADD